MSDPCAGLNQTSCENNSQCLIWRLNGQEVFSKCMLASDCKEDEGMSNFLGACTCENAGWNFDTEKCECGPNTNPKTIYSMVEIDGESTCLPLGSCPNNTKYLVFNNPNNNKCQCVPNADPAGLITENNENFETCACKTGMVPAEDFSSCVLAPVSPPDSSNSTPGQNNPGDENVSGASPVLALFIICLVTAILACCAVLVARMRSATKRRATTAAEQGVEMIY